MINCPHFGYAHGRRVIVVSHQQPILFCNNVMHFIVRRSVVLFIVSGFGHELVELLLRPADLSQFALFEEV